MSDWGNRFEELREKDDKPIEDIVEQALTMVEYWAPWCPHCRLANSIVNGLSSKPENADVRFVRINIDEMPEAVSSMGPRSIPTFSIWNHGREIEKRVGGQHGNVLMDMIAVARVSCV